jgi:hypothetical protein
MWDFISPVNLIRYLVIWRVNGSLVQLPRCLSTALSQVLGTMITNRLPTQQARDWRKALQAWDNTTATVPQEKPSRMPIPDVVWPIEAVLFPYRGKRAYGQGEVILWELKLVGDSADHGLFLELVLPAMEEAASTTDPRWRRSKSLWGRFDIQAVYAARGARWEPMVSDGQLDLNYRASPTQWAEGLTFGRDLSSTSSETKDLKHRLLRLTWVTPFDFGLGSTSDNPKSKIQDPQLEEPTLQDILDALMDRMTLFLPGKNRTAKDAWALVNSDEQSAIQDVLPGVKPLSRQRQTLRPAPKGCPGRWIGTQTFTTIPESLLPYLELASILHVGKQTHFGCGTFVLT